MFTDFWQQISNSDCSFTGCCHLFCPWLTIPLICNDIDMVNTVLSYKTSHMLDCRAITKRCRKHLYGSKICPVIFEYINANQKKN